MAAPSGLELVEALPAGGSGRPVATATSTGLVVRP